MTVPKALEADAELLQQFARRGFRFVFYPSRQKGPSGEGAKGWTTREYRPEDYRDGMNVGVKLGTELTPGKFLVDIDFDWPDGLDLTRTLLPATEFGFGRESRSLSHAFFTTPQPVRSKRFEDIDDKVLVEIRGTKADGAIGCQTMIPPSIHPSGEVVTLRYDGEIGHCDDLQQRVTHYAIACILKKHIGYRGLLHDARLAFAGFLLGECRLPEADVIAIGEALAKSTGNDAVDISPTVRSTAARLRGGQRITGAKSLAKTIGDDGRRLVERIREWCSPDTLDTKDIVVRGGDLPAIVDRVEAALLASAIPIYQRGGALVRPVRLDTSTQSVVDGVRRNAGSVVLVSVREPWLVEQAARILRWLRPAKDEGFVPIDPPAIYARTLLNRGEWDFPVLRCIVSAPTLAGDGRIIEKPGFDEASGLLLEFGSGAFPPVPERPTQDDARAALERLARPLRGFPYVDDPSKSVGLSALLTAIVRPSLRTAPLHGFDAPAAGTGKSLHAELAGLLATGARPPALSQGKSAEEDEKRLATVLAAGDPVIHIDNCERNVSGDFLCSMSTQELVQVRILGQSERRVLPSTAFVVISGNNLTFAGDTSRRAVMCRLDAGVEQPDQRPFDFDCHAEVLRDRAELVVAGLTVLRAYALAGHPVRLTPMGSFADWDWIRGALVWLGYADPADTRDAILREDPRKDELHEVMDLWEQAFGRAEIEVGEIDKRAAEERQNCGDVSTAVQDLRQKLVEVSCRARDWSGKSVGWWLRHHKDRVVGGRCFQSDQDRSRQRWRLESRRGDALPLALPRSTSYVQADGDM